VPELELTADERPGGLTLRALALGLVAVLTVNIGAPYSKYILHSSLLACDYFPLGVIFPFFVIVTVVNVLLKLVARRFALKPSELALIFIMGLVGSTIPTFGLTGYLISNIAAPYYFASPENEWEKYIFPHMADWLIPTNAHRELTYFFEGLPKGEAIPWGVWLGPLFWWLSLAGTVFFVSLCIIVILRKQWVEHERLVFPLAEVPLELVRDSDDGRLLPGFMRPTIFWFGFGLPLFVVGWNMVGYWITSWPTINLLSWRVVPLPKGYGQILLNIYFPIVGFAYLINLDVALSVWLFRVVDVVEEGIFNQFGIACKGNDPYSEAAPAVAWQAWGAMVVMVIVGLVMARRHIKQVFRKAFTGARDVDDSDELFSYRTAVFGLLLGLIYICVWLYGAGMPPHVIALFLFGVFVGYIGVTRIVVEGGLVYLRTPLIPQPFVLRVLGTQAIGEKGLVSLAQSMSWYCDVKCFFMAGVAHAAKLADLIRVRKRAVVWAIVIAVVVGTVSSMWFTLYAGYREGAYNYGDWIFMGGGLKVGGATYPLLYFTEAMKTPVDFASPDTQRILYMGIGGAAMAVLTVLRLAFHWWPVHPLGLAVCSTLPIRCTAFSVFLAWAAKSIIMRLGGIRLYRSIKPFFIGLIVGHFTGCGISFVVDMIFFSGQTFLQSGRGHFLYGW